MAIKLSQAACEAISGKILGLRQGANLALVDSATGYDRITDVGSLLLASGFAVGQQVHIFGAASASNDLSLAVLEASAGFIGFPTGSLVGSESSGNASLSVRSVKRGSLAELFHNARMDWYSGSMPSTPDNAENGTLLVSFTGIRFANVAWDATNKIAYIDLLGGTAKQATAVADGTAGWFRLRGGGVFTTGASTTMIRMDGTIGVGTGDLRVSSTTITTSATETLNMCKLKVPQA